MRVGELALGVKDDIRLALAFGKRLFERHGGRDLAAAPETLGDLAHLRVALGLSGEGGRARRTRADHRRAGVHEALHTFGHLRAHRLELRQDEHFVGRAVREHDASLFIDARRLGQDFGVDVVELAARRKRRVADARHAGRVLSDEVRDVGDVEPLPQHPPAAFQVAREEIEMLEPRVVAVELFAEPRDAPGLLVALLLNIDVQDRRVEPFRKKAVGALLQVHRPALKPIMPARVGLRPDEPSAVDVRAARRGAVFDVAERPLAPVFTGDSVGLPAVL